MKALQIQEKGRTIKQFWIIVLKNRMIQRRKQTFGRHLDWSKIPSFEKCNKKKNKT